MYQKKKLQMELYYMYAIGLVFMSKIKQKMKM